jgi:hypothetical protein
MDNKILEAWLGLAVALLLLLGVSWFFRPSQAHSLFHQDCACLAPDSGLG